MLVLLNTGDGERAVAADGDVVLHTGGVSLDPDGALLLAPDTCCWVELA